MTDVAGSSRFKFYCQRWLMLSELILRHVVLTRDPSLANPADGNWCGCYDVQDHGLGPCTKARDKCWDGIIIYIRCICLCKVKVEYSR